MKQRFFAILLALALLLSGCAAQKSEPSADILATTAPVAQIVGAITAGTDLTVATLISEPVSCVHDYALSVDQMRAVEQAKLIVISGAGLEEFMGATLASCDVVIDASEGLALLPGEEGESDPHTWLAPENMIAMTHTVETALAAEYPQHAALFAENADIWCGKLDELQAYGEQLLSSLSCRRLVTFHDGFAYFAKAFDLEIAASMEIEAGSEPSARELEAIISLLQDQGIPAVFTEINGTADAAELVSRETGCAVCERTPEGTLLVKELLGCDPVSGGNALLYHFHLARGAVRFPDPHGTPFCMGKALAQSPLYLGLAFD